VRRRDKPIKKALKKDKKRKERKREKNDFVKRLE
jgi:hypothetical protein